MTSHFYYITCIGLTSFLHAAFWFFVDLLSVETFMDIETFFLDI